MAEEKRKRSPNWMPSEKYLLLELVKEHFHIIENKKTDGVNMRQKIAEWAIISNKCISQTSNYWRSAENLKTQWENMKKAAKKEEARHRIELIKTGGGPPLKPKKEDPMHNEIIALIKTSAIGLHNPFDSDGVICMEDPTTDQSEKSQANPAISEASKPIIIITVPAVDNPIQIEGDNAINNDEGGTSILEPEKDWSNYTPQLLKTPISAPLKKTDGKKNWMSRRRPTHSAASSLEMLHRTKIEAINTENERAAAEAEKNKIITDLNIEIKKEILKEEKLKTELLLLEVKKKKKELNDDE